jgi:peptidoglycan/LPS O-acetylase OafA/YrhL
MPRVSQLFFAVAAICGIAGIVWGIMMAESQDHLQMPAHAHLNLLGWVGSAIYGTYFALNPGRFRRSAWLVLVLNTAGTAVMIPMLALFYASQMQATQYLMPLTAGTVLILAAMVVFATAVFRRLFSA